MVLDQPFDGSSVKESMKYYRDSCAIVADRDPRDQYLFFKEFLYPKGHGTLIPIESVDDFILFYRLMRKNRDLKNEHILSLKFEELIYDYERTVKKIECFAGLQEHRRPQQEFRPSESANNTQLFRRFSGHIETIKRIERELEDYLFNFDKYPSITPQGGMFWGSNSRKKKLH
jgi:hypothetical protein